MASQVLSGNGNVSYTNNTGQNVRVVINFLGYFSPNLSGISLSWAGNPGINMSAAVAIGRNLAISGGGPQAGAQTGLSVYANNMITLDSAYGGSETFNAALPTELMLAPSQSFFGGSISGANAPYIVYNIVIIPENG